MSDYRSARGSNADQGPLVADDPKSYEISGRIMLTAIVILFGVVVFLVILHLYARWYLLRLRRQYHERRRGSRRQHRPTRIVFYVDPNSAAAPSGGGLDDAVLKSLPVFVYSSGAYPHKLPECAVCLSEFEEREKGRMLPKCNHSFHTACIDMWFQSHSTCPLCRSPVEALPSPATAANPPEIAIPVTETPKSEEGSSSTREEMHETTPLAGRRKRLDGVTIEVPRRSELEPELVMSSPASLGFRSPGSRLMSLKRILSMNRKAAPVSPSGLAGTSCARAIDTEFDIESGRTDSTRPRTPS